MFANIPDGRNARDQFDSANSRNLGRLAKAKRAAWALSIGESPRALDPPRRLHRGLLPDVDMSRVVPDPNHRSLLGRIVALFGRLVRRPNRARPAARTMAGDSG